MPTWSIYDPTHWDKIINDWKLPETYTVSNLTITTNVPEKKGFPNVKQVYFNQATGHTTIVWNDGTSTTVHCGDGEPFERYMGFCAAVVKKLYGSTAAAQRLMNEKDNELAKARKEEERQKKIRERQEMETKNRERKAKREEGRFKKVYELVEKYMPKPDLSELMKLFDVTGESANE